MLFGLGEVVDSPIYLFRPEYDKTLVELSIRSQKSRWNCSTKPAGATATATAFSTKKLTAKRIPLRFEIKLNSGNAMRKSVALGIAGRAEKARHRGHRARTGLDDFLDDVKNHKFDAVILGWAMSVTEPDAYQVWHSSQAANKGSNQISYKNSRVDKIFEDYRREFDPQETDRAVPEFQRILNEEQPYTFLSYRKSVVGGAAALSRR